MKLTRLCLCVFAFLLLQYCEKEAPTAYEKDGLSKQAFDHLEANRSLVDPAQPNTYSFISDEVLQTKNVIFTGESHAVSSNAVVELGLIKYLKQKGWLDYYMPELPYSFCLMLNRYLETGDQAILTRLFIPLQGTFFWTEQQYNKLIELYNFNQTLPQEERIHIVGAEIEHQFENALWALSDMVPDKLAPFSIRHLIEELVKLNLSYNKNYLLLSDLTKEIERNFTNYTPLFEEYFGADWPSFKHLIESVNQSWPIVTIEDRNTFRVEREKVIFNNFKKLQAQLPPGNWYGQWGSWHITKRPLAEQYTIAAFLNGTSTSTLQNKVITILYLYYNSEKLDRSPYRVEQHSNVSYHHSMGLLRLGTYTAFNLNGNGSPFEDQLFWPTIGVRGVPGALTDYYDYMIVMDRVGASTPLQ